MTLKEVTPVQIRRLVQDLLRRYAGSIIKESVPMDSIVNVNIGVECAVSLDKELKAAGR